MGDGTGLKDVQHVVEEGELDVHRHLVVLLDLDCLVADRVDLSFMRMGERT